MSKMGISVISSYRGGLNFEAVGLSRAMCAEYFPGLISRISGIGVSGIQQKSEEIHNLAYRSNSPFACRWFLQIEKIGRDPRVGGADNAFNASCMQ